MAPGSARILLAVESGSRAWGFASPNSDFDVRFIYVRPKNWYLSIDLDSKRDVIEYPIVDDIDLNGWDVRKALRLFAKSNPAFVEWIQSPICYMAPSTFAAMARQWLPEVYTQANGMIHYRSMAKTNYREYIRGDLVPLKKYFYVLRPLLAARWIERFGAAPPIEFDRLLTLLADNPDVLAEVHTLLERKKLSLEKDLIPAVPALNAFIEAELLHLESFEFEKTELAETTEKLNGWFRAILEHEDILNVPT